MLLIRRQGNDPYASIYGPVMDGSFAIPALEIDLVANQEAGARRESASQACCDAAFHPACRDGNTIAV